MTDKPVLPYSVTCSKKGIEPSCAGTLSSEAYDHPQDFIAAAKVQGWIVPAATENKPILCPKCKTK